MGRFRIFAIQGNLAQQRLNLKLTRANAVTA